MSSSIPSWQTLTAHAQPFRGARDLAFCLKVPLDSLLIWASSEGSGETARMRRLAWTFAARIGDKYQIRLTRSIFILINGAMILCRNNSWPKRHFAEIWHKSRTIQAHWNIHVVTCTWLSIWSSLPILWDNRLKTYLQLYVSTILWIREFPVSTFRRKVLGSNSLSTCHKSLNSHFSVRLFTSQMPNEFVNVRMEFGYHIMEPMMPSDWWCVAYYLTGLNKFCKKNKVGKVSHTKYFSF